MTRRSPRRKPLKSVFTWFVLRRAASKRGGIYSSNSPSSKASGASNADSNSNSMSTCPQCGQRNGILDRRESRQNWNGDSHCLHFHFSRGPRRVGSIELPATSAIRGLEPRRKSINPATEMAMHRNRSIPTVDQTNHFLGL